MPAKKVPAKKPAAKKTPARAKSERTAAALGRFPDDATIKVLVQNARRPGSKAAKRFSLYKNGQTVAQYVDAGGRRSSVRTDLKRGNIELTPPPK